MSKLDKFNELETGIRLSGREKHVHVAINTTDFDNFLTRKKEDLFLYVAVDDKNCIDGEYEALSFDQTVRLRDYLTKIIELRG